MQAVFIILLTSCLHTKPAPSIQDQNTCAISHHLNDYSTECTTIWETPGRFLHKMIGTFSRSMMLIPDSNRQTMSTHKESTTLPLSTTRSSLDTTITTLPIDDGFSSFLTMAFAILVTFLWCISALFLIRKCFNRKLKKSYVEVEDPLIAPSECKTFLHEHIEDLKYDSRYEVEKRNLDLGSYLGGGYFGAVYEGTLNISRQWPSRSPIRRFIQRIYEGQKRITVAVKTAGEARTLEDVQLRKKIMEDELKLMCSVGSHPNIVTLIGAITHPGNPEGVQIIMEKCNSGSLFNYLFAQRATFTPQFEKKWNRMQLEDCYGYRVPDGKSRKTTLPVTYKTLENKASCKGEISKEISTAHLLSFAMQIAEGMDYLAANKCLHRDLAARNILLTSEGLCKIADFGLAKRIGYQEYYRPQRVQDLPERWMAVECLKERKFTIESDIWSYGILLYEIFTLADLPYPKIQGEVTDHVLGGLRNDQPEYCPDAIYHHMTLCWDSDKEKRPSFKDSANLMKKHLSQASKQVLEKVGIETLRETGRQRQLEALRSQGQFMHR